MFGCLLAEDRSGCHGVDHSPSDRTARRIAADVARAVRGRDCRGHRASTATASRSSLSACRSSMAPDRIAPSGLAMSRPAISGAEPCTGSNRPVPSPRLADGRRPSDPTTAPASSERMSPNMFSVRITSNDAGASATAHRARVDIHVVHADVSVIGRHAVHHIPPQSGRLEHVGLVDRHDVAASQPGGVEGDRAQSAQLRPGNNASCSTPSHRRLKSRGARRSTGPRSARERPACRFARARRASGADVLETGPDAGRPQVRIEAEPLAKLQQGGLGATTRRKAVELRIPHRAEKNGIGLQTGGDGVVGQRRAAASKRGAANYALSNVN